MRPNERPRRTMKSEEIEREKERVWLTIEPVRVEFGRSKVLKCLVAALQFGSIDDGLNRLSFGGSVEQRS